MRFHNVPVRAAIHATEPGSGYRQWHFSDRRPRTSWRRKLAHALMLVFCAWTLGMLSMWAAELARAEYLPSQTTARA